MTDFSDAIGSGNGVQDFQYTLSPSGKTINHLALPNQGPYVDDSTPIRRKWWKAMCATAPARPAPSST